MTSRRDSLRKLGAAIVTSGALSGSVGAAAASRPDPQAGPLAADRPVSPVAFDAPLDGQRSDSSAIQAAINFLAAKPHFGGTVAVDSGIVLLTSPVELTHYITLSFGRAEVQMRPGESHAIGIGLTSPAFSTTLSGRLLQLQGANRTAVAVRDGAGFQMIDCDIDLRAEGQTGLVVSANDDPLGPYQGLVENVRINGVGLAGQTGIVLRQKFANGSIAVNRWIFSNLRHIASVDVGMDLQGTDGLIITNVNFESCRVSGIRFGAGGRQIRGRVARPLGTGRNGGFASPALAQMALDPVGGVQVLSGRNEGESMVVTTVTPAGEVRFPTPFPYPFAEGDEFVFSESKCRSVAVTGATYEGGSNDDEVAFDFQAGARSCRAQIGMMTMAKGAYFRRAIEDLSNTIASRTDTIRLAVDLDQGDGELWLPGGEKTPGRGRYLMHDPSWIDAIFVTAERGNAGLISVDVISAGDVPALSAKLTPDSPNYARRIRRLLPANAMMGEGMGYGIRIRKSQLRGPERLNIEVIVGIL